MPKEIKPKPLKNNVLTISMTGNDVFYYWIKSIKQRLISAVK